MPACRLPLACLVPALLLGLAAPAPAQDGTGATVFQARPEASAAAPGRSLLAESVEDPATLLRLAESALRSGRLGEATELLERAEARLLTRSELASEADRPAVGGAVGELAAARDAIGRRDGAGAAGLVASALSRLERGEPSSVTALPATPPATPPATGAPAPMPPAAGGGAMLPPPTKPPPL